MTNIIHPDAGKLLDLKPAHLILPKQDPATEHISIDDAKNEREVFLTIKRAFEYQPPFDLDKHL
tara:strand:- start:555 stop:746 length:192 start_codon:yes stop_codon:yes gene_type:complete